MNYWNYAEQMTSFVSAPASIMNLYNQPPNVHQNNQTYPTQTLECVTSVAPAVLAVFLGKPLLTGRGHIADLWRENLANWDGYGQLLSSQHLRSEPSFFFFSLHFNKLLFREMLPLCLIGMQKDNALISRTTLRLFTYTICLTLLPSPWHSELVANTSIWCTDLHIKKEE